MKLHVEIVSPIGIVYKDDVDEITVPTQSGYIGILPHHVPLLTQVTSGELSVKKGSSSQLLAITGGFLEVANNKVTILADYAVRSEDVEVAKAESAKKRAEQLLKEKLSERDFVQVEGELRRSLLELKVAKRRRSTLPPTHQ